MPDRRARRADPCGRPAAGEPLWSDGRLSKRMEAIVSLVTGGGPVVDVGCDHAYLPIALIERGICTSAQACDVRRGPLGHAAANVAEAGLTGRICLIRCDGIPKEAAGGTLLITGMGGPLILRILADGASLLPRFSELILEPQSDVGSFRRELLSLGYEAADERMVLEDGKFYACIRAVRAEGSGPEEAEEKRQERTGVSDPLSLRFGPKLLSRRDPVLFLYLKKMEQTKEELLETLTRSESAAARARAEELEAELATIREAKSLYESEGRDPAT